MEMLGYLEKLIADRRVHPRPGSYTNALLEAGTPRIAQKVGEEGVEVAVAVLSQNKLEQIGEIADLLFHLLVLMHDRGISLAEVDAELSRRHEAGGSTSGISAPSG
jgi:phosphoribosyl-ATP pyrophosphohydrolase